MRLRVLFAVPLAAALFAVSPSSEAASYHLSGASCVPNPEPGNSPDLDYSTAGSIRNRTGTTQSLICAAPNGGFFSGYTVTMKFDNGAQFEGGTDCILRATDSSGAVYDSESENYYGQAIYQLQASGSTSVSTTANVRCNLPKENGNGNPGVRRLEWSIN